MSALHTPRKHYFSQVPFQLTFKTERFLDFILEVKFSLFSRIQTSHTEQFRLKGQLCEMVFGLNQGRKDGYKHPNIFHVGPLLTEICSVLIIFRCLAYSYIHIFSRDNQKF